MRKENKEMKRYLSKNNIFARVKYLDGGSLAGRWRLYNPRQIWNEVLAEQLTNLGFTDFDGKPLGKFSGNGGLFSVFALRKGEINENDKSR